MTKKRDKIGVIAEAAGLGILAVLGILLAVALGSVLVAAIIGMWSNMDGFI